jgi:hypothetical protein
MVRLLGLGAACMVIVAACASSKQVRAPATEAPASTAGATMPNDPHAEIERLYAEIEAQRGQGELPEPAAPATAAPAEAMASVPLSSEATCKPAKTDRCTQSCELSDSICTNAGRICELAAQIPQDAWAADKCGRAKQTCETAHESCCTCQ